MPDSPVHSGDLGAAVVNQITLIEIMLIELLILRPWFERCVGLFTLTSTQLKFLEQNLRPKYTFPIVQIHYPAVVEPAELDPSLNSRDYTHSIFFIGEFDRDFEHFFEAKFPPKFQKILLLQRGASIASNCVPSDVIVRDFVCAPGYEQILHNAVIFLSLKHGGAANTVVIECITRNAALIAPNLESVTDYVGADYPLLYEKGTIDFTELINEQTLENGREYFRKMEKNFISKQHFVKSIATSAIASFSCIPKVQREISTFDVTILICSFQRTHNLQAILESLVNKQNFTGRYEIIIWNNNSNRKQRIVNAIVES